MYKNMINILSKKVFVYQIPFLYYKTLISDFGLCYYNPMKKIRALINTDLDRVEKSLNNLFDTDNNILECLDEFIIKGSSKRIRSILCILYLKANNINIDNNIIKILTAGELIHNASLLHDDVIDNSEQRRNKIAFHKRFDCKTAILSGDFLLSIAVKNLLELNNIKILNTFLQTTQKMSKAEIQQYINRDKQINIEEYFDVVDGKTSSLFQAILISAAESSGLQSEKTNKFGKYFGRLFQINNDCQNESIKDDKNNGIKTIIDILSIEKIQSLKDNYKELLKEIINSLPNKDYSNGLEDLTELL